MNGRRGWPYPLVLGAVLGVTGVAFVLVFALFVRDLGLSAETCTMQPQGGAPGIAAVELCLNRTQAAAGRLWWEIAVLVLAVGLLGLTLARWRHIRTREPGSP